jgi:hypothetical protein
MALTRIQPAAIADVREPNFRNIVINGDMAVAQRGTSTASITTENYYTVDRFNTFITTLGTWTQSQDTDVPTGSGFATSLKMDCTSADASPAAGDRLVFQQKIEGQNVQYLKKGTSSAVPITLSFWVKSVLTGTYIAELYDNDNTRQVSKSYTISSASTWEKKTITFPADTTGALGNDTGDSLILQLWLGAGSTYTSGSLNTSWAASTNANRAVGQVNLANSTSNNFWITGIQLEAGSVATDFEVISFGQNLLRCQRYFQKIDATGTNTIITTMQAYASDNAVGDLPTLTELRANPTLSTTGTFNAWTSDASNKATGAIALYSASTTQQGILFTRASEGTLSAGNASGLYAGGSATILLSAEL